MRFGTKTELEVHTKKVQFGEREHKCSVCGKKFGKKSSVQAHMKLVHAYVAK